MTTHRTDAPVSRRTVLTGLGAGGLGLALAARGLGASAQEATPVPSTTAAIEERLGVAYGEADGAPLLLDAYLPSAPATPRPAVIVLHGGAWTREYEDRSIMTDHARALAQAGYAAFNVEYRLTTVAGGSNPWPAQLDDVQHAVRWVRANADEYGVDPERIGSFGHSAGGHLASMLGLRETRDTKVIPLTSPIDPALAGYSSRVGCVVELAGELDMTLAFDGFIRDRVVDLVGGTPEEVPWAYGDASPLSWIDQDTVPFMVLTGALDPDHVTQQRRMVGVLEAAGAEVIAGEFPGADHFVWEDWARSAPWALAFFGHHLHPET
jgi:acetyl esterase/lipase